MNEIKQMVGITCRRCAKTTLMIAPELAWAEWELPRGSRRLVQDIFPDLSIGDRELLISRTCNTCWQELFGNGEDEEEQA